MIPSSRGITNQSSITPLPAVAAITTIHGVTTSTAPSSTSAHMAPVPVKLVLLGEAAVGKTSLVARYVQGDYTENRESSIGVAYMSQLCSVGKVTIKFDIWDTAGQERFHSLAPLYYRNAHAAIVVYDVTRIASLERARHWIKELRQQTSTTMIIALVGNKIDLVIDKSIHQEDTPEIQRIHREATLLSEEEGLLLWQTSAKLGTNITQVFHDIAKNVPLEFIAQTRSKGSQNIDTSSGPTSLDPMRGERISHHSIGGCAC
ncbi:ras family-domain-containing protein [Spinellus fusiger]|nr:ras family-domain-containing protein [Spinellus fusiger]